MNKTSSKIWFKTRDLGWGWTPISPEGHLVVGLFLVLVFTGVALAVFAVGDGIDRNLVGRIMIAWILILTVALIRICYVKGERPGSF